MKRLTLAVLLVLALPAVRAHAPPPAQEYETRILADYNDDWFGTQDGHNLVSLDIREGYNATLGDNVLIFRLMISGGYAAAPFGGGSELRDVITFKADGQEKELEFATADNVAFTGTFDAVHGPEPVLVNGAQDGTRVFVTGVARFSTLGIQSGSNLTDWFVNGFANAMAGDNMPEGLAPGAPEPPNPSIPPDPGNPDGDPVWFDIGEYTVRAPDYYVSVAAEPATLTLTASTEEGNETSDGETDGHDEGEDNETGHDAGNATPSVPMQATIKVTVRNLLPATPQTILVTATSEGLALELGNGSSRTIDLAGGASQDIELTVTAGHESGTIPVHIMAISTLDGMGMSQVNVVVEESAPDNATADHDADEDHHEEKKDTPAPSLALLVGLLAAAIVIMRRRM